MTCFGHNPHAKPERVRWGLLFFWLAYLSGVTALVACGAREAAAAVRAQAATDKPPAEASAPAPATIADADKRIAAAEQRARDADARSLRDHQEAEEARAEAKGLRKDRDLLADEVGRARLAWVAGILQMAAIGFGAFAFFSPVGRTWIVYAAVGCQSGAALALAVRAVYAWLPVVGGFVGLAFVVIAAWKVRKLVLAGQASADHGDRLEQAILGVHDWIAGERASVADVLSAVKAESAKRQKAAGVRGAVAALRGKPVKPLPAPEDQPPAPAVAGGAA